MHDFDMQPRGPGKIDRLSNSVENLVGFIADMGEIGGIVALQDGAEGKHLGGLGEAPRRREEARGHAERAGTEPFLQERDHLR